MDLNFNTPTYFSLFFLFLSVDGLFMTNFTYNFNTRYTLTNVKCGIITGRYIYVIFYTKIKHAYCISSIILVRQFVILTLTSENTAFFFLLMIDIYQKIHVFLIFDMFVCQCYSSIISTLKITIPNIFKMI